MRHLLAFLTPRPGFSPRRWTSAQRQAFLFVVNFNLHGDHVLSNVSVIDTVSMTEIAQIEQGRTDTPHDGAPPDLHPVAKNLASATAKKCKLPASVTPGVSVRGVVDSYN